MGLFWRPEVLANAFAGDTLDDLYVTGKNPTTDDMMIIDTHPACLVPDGRQVVDGGRGAAKSIVAKCLKAAHPKDGEEGDGLTWLTDSGGRELAYSSSEHMPYLLLHDTSTRYTRCDCPHSPRCRHVPRC